MKRPRLKWSPPHTVEDIWKQAASHSRRESPRKPQKRINRAQRSTQKAETTDEDRDVFMILDGMTQDPKWMKKVDSADFEAEAIKRYTKS